VSVHKNRVAAPPVMTMAGIIFGQDHSAVRDNDMIAASRVLFPSLEVDRHSNPDVVKPQPRPLVARHGLYTIERGLLVATNRKSGQRMWQLRTDGETPAEVPSPLLYAGKSILMATARGNVLRLDPETGAVVDAFPLVQGVFASQPIAVDGWLYAGTKGGEVVAYDTGHSELTGWEMLGGSPARRGSADEEGS
jgi:outer membrane protein assembly factor BamB